MSLTIFQNSFVLRSLSSKMAEKSFIHPPPKKKKLQKIQQGCSIPKPLFKSRWVIHSYTFSFLCCQENREQN